MTPLHTVGLTHADLPHLRRLAQACLHRDGGLPRFADETMLRARLLRDRSVGLRLPDDDTLIAAAGIGFVDEEATTSGMVHPGMRRRGLGRRLLGWAIGEAGTARLRVETESWSADTEALYSALGLVRNFAEYVMRHDLRDAPDLAIPS